MKLRDRVEHGDAGRGSIEVGLESDVVIDLPTQIGAHVHAVDGDLAGAAHDRVVLKAGPQADADVQLRIRVDLLLGGCARGFYLGRRSIQGRGRNRCDGRNRSRVGLRRDVGGCAGGWLGSQRSDRAGVRRGRGRLCAHRKTQQAKRTEEQLKAETKKERVEALHVRFSLRLAA